MRQCGVTRAGCPDLPFDLLVLCENLLNLFLEGGCLLFRVLAVQQLDLDRFLALEQLLQAALALQQCRINSLANVGLGFGQGLQQASRPCPLAGLQRLRFIPITGCS